ncbi:PaaX family transcriptional regulator C-terminal domain-containing protein [Sulfitobacter albidus]|uniref:PaaX family transcriptional regulator C-terminal domain-containing protein n=1 Tax=Sulfitobacter albidus TaxID=2829501 RepID=UPI0020C8BC53|nr:PaaX family transcriptional regulator C-terminal domain-containing protein [Sulfitobacter albidus]
MEGPVLSALMAEMSVKPEAVRVALHRLRKEDWLTSRKTGRTGRHALTAKSRRESQHASARIYAAPGDGPDGWQMVMLEHPHRTAPEKMAKRGFHPLIPRLYIGGAQAKAPKHALTLGSSQVPDWLRSEIAQGLYAPEYDALARILTRAQATLDPADLSALQIAVLRCLIVHNWRRIVLKHPVLPKGLLPDDWPGHRCHALVDRLLARLPRPAIETIQPD